MENQRKVFVFSKNEIVLIFLFIILISITSFVFGIKVGKGYSYQKANLTTADRIAVELKSEQEEKVDNVLNDRVNDDSSNRKVLDDTYKKLEAEFENLDEEKKVDIIEQARIKEVAPTEQEMVKDVAPIVETPSVDIYSGKYTLQLASYRSIDDAEKFADGFRVRGYDPMVINKVEIKNRGTWFRVSLGVFDSLNQTKAFIKKEQSLLKNSSYVIRKFD